MNIEVNQMKIIFSKMDRTDPSQPFCEIYDANTGANVGQIVAEMHDVSRASLGRVWRTAGYSWEIDYATGAGAHGFTQVRQGEAAASVLALIKRHLRTLAEVRGE